MSATFLLGHSKVNILIQMSMKLSQQFLISHETLLFKRTLNNRLCQCCMPGVVLEKNEINVFWSLSF